MPLVKSHLKDLYRVKLEEPRLGSLRLDMNEGVPGLPEYFVKKASLRINADFLSTYPEYKALQQKIAQLNNLKPENICLSNGSDAAIKYIFDAYISPEDKVLLTDPTFAMYPVYSKMFGAQPIMVEYRDDLSFPFEDFIEKITPEIKLAVVINPNNPTGSILKEKELLEIIKKAAKENVLMIIDEAYFYFYPHTAIGKIKEYKNLIVLRTFSKLLGMAAARLGYAVGCPEIIENLRKVRPTFDVNALAVLFAGELLNRTEIIKKLLAETRKGQVYLEKKLQEEKIEYKKGHANFLLINCGKRVNEIIKKLAQKHILVNGNFKQHFLKDYIRITLADKRILEKFWKIFIKIWRDQKEKSHA